MSQPTKPLNLTPTELTILSKMLEQDTRFASYNNVTLAGLIVLENIKAKISKVLPPEVNKETK